MRRIVLTLLALLLTSCLFAFGLVLPQPGETEYTLLDGDDSFTVDETVYYKTVLGRKVVVERYTDTITSLSYGWNTMLVLAGAEEAEVEEILYVFRFIDNISILAVDSPLSIDVVKELNPDHIYVSGGLSSSTRAMLRLEKIPFTELGEGDILQIEDDGISVISGSASGVYVTCPNCGTVIYVPTGTKR